MRWFVWLTKQQNFELEYLFALKWTLRACDCKNYIRINHDGRQDILRPATLKLTGSGAIESTIVRGIFRYFENRFIGTIA